MTPKHDENQDILTVKKFLFQVLIGVSIASVLAVPPFIWKVYGLESQIDKVKSVYEVKDQAISAQLKQMNDTLTQMRSDTSEVRQMLFEQMNKK